MSLLYECRLYEPTNQYVERVLISISLNVMKTHTKGTNVIVDCLKKFLFIHKACDM